MRGWVDVCNLPLLAHFHRFFALSAMSRRFFPLMFLPMWTLGGDDDDDGVVDLLPTGRTGRRREGREEIVDTFGGIL